MRLLLLLPGKLRDAHCRALTDDYVKRCRRLGTSLELVFVREQSERRGVSRSDALAKEGRAMLDRVPSRWRIVALDERGEQATSRQFSGRLRKWRDGAVPGVAFLVGSARGLDATVLDAADLKLSLSRMTLPHELVFPVFSEQIYRALTIIAGHPYHRD